MQSWVIKKELFDIPVFGLGLRLVEPIAVDRTDSNSVTQILNMGAEKIKAGLWVVIFPEATRVPVGRRVNLKPSGAKLAIENQVPIVLMAHNAGLFWPKGFWVNKSGTIRVKIGPILHPKHGDDVRELTKQIQDWMHHEKDILSGHIEE
jgi:1-acyl-sn-glycerol-3-phosphate acyltransferase